LPYGTILFRASDQASFHRSHYISTSNYVSNIRHWVDKAIRKAVQIESDNRYEKLSELESDLRKPNPSFLREEQLPLLKLNPLGFWKAMTGILFVANLVLLYLHVTHN
jgi:hypothetical protein